ncbi:hypothetical protein ACFQ6B_10715 [Streptomyces wedmorensis]|uniref:Uncharacterized protein n=1 Tax=Streptomyces wedmorensis TaxID=43759 RepID=A0ABW6ILX6_STRWE
MHSKRDHPGETRLTPRAHQPSEPRPTPFPTARQEILDTLQEAARLLSAG